LTIITTVGGPEALTPLEAVKIFEEESGRRFEIATVPETKLREQLESADESLEKSFAGLMLQYAQGDAINTLVGHSYAGMVITGVAERESGRLSRLIYVDAFVPDDGESALDLLPEPIQESFRTEAHAKGEGWRLPATESLLDLWGLQPGAAREYVRTRSCDFSLRCFQQKVQLPSNAAAKMRKTFIAAVAKNYPARFVFERFGERARREGWDYHELAAGHDCHVEVPDGFVSLLLADDARSATEV
jgi:pimeloyl-ACP methyl ester carboxylesterase